MIWREILLQLLSHSGDEGDEHKWAIPSAISAEQHKGITALENKILEFFAQRTTVPSRNPAIS